MHAASFDLTFGHFGPEKVFINGNDVTEAIAGVSFLSQDGQPPLIRLGLKPGIELHTIAGEGIVEVEPAANDAARWLANIDAQALDDAVMARMSMSGMSGGATPIQAALSQLREWAGEPVA